MSITSDCYLKSNETRDKPRVFVFWYIVTTTLCVLGLLENITETNYFFLLILCFFPNKLPLKNRLLIIALAFAGWFSGPASNLIIYPVALYLTKVNFQAFKVFLYLVVLVLLRNQIDNIPDKLINGIHVASLAQIFIPAVFSLLVWYRFLSNFLVLKYFLAISAVFIIVVLSSNTWINIDLFTTPLFRSILSTSPGLVLIKQETFVGFSKSYLSSPYIIFFFIIGLLVPFIIPNKPISEIYFDEGHGEWETTQRTFNPSDFGRFAYYNYSLLSKFTSSLYPTKNLLNEQMNLPSVDSLIVIKMPTKPFSENYTNNILEWVKLGGRLLIIADHTDLYDTATNINAFLKRLTELEIRPDAVFDRSGMPVERVNKEGGFLMADILPYRENFKWLTGTSFKNIPLGAVTLSTYGSSFSEPGDYSKENRFGYFRQKFDLRFINQSSIVSKISGNGLVTVVLDSTMWSNFSFFKYEYRKLFSELIKINERIIIFKTLNYLIYILLGVVVFGLIKKDHYLIVYLLSLLLGLIIGCFSSIGVKAFLAPYESPKTTQKLSIVTGRDVKFEILRQLIKPGENNYNRIVASLPKYGFDPVTKPISPQSNDLIKDYLYLEPDSSQLPTLRNLSQIIANGSNVTFLFNPYQATNIETRAWLNSLAISIKQSSSLAISENILPIKNTLLTRKSPVLRKVSNLYTIALSNSIFKEYRSDYFIQTYTIRPTELPRKSGVLNIGFSADQFSDNSIGDVWEGIDPSAIGKFREQQLADILMVKSNLSLFPDDLVFYQQGTLKKKNSFTKYALLQDNKIISEGSLDASYGASDNSYVFLPKLNNETYFTQINRSVIEFISKHCTKVKTITSCSKRYLAPDLTEWMVSWESSLGAIKTIELNHDRNFSGLGHSYKLIYE